MKFALYAALALALSAPAFAQNTTIAIKDFKFMAMDATVTPGLTVT